MTRLEAALQRRFRAARDTDRGMMPQLGRVIAVDNAQRRIDVALEGDRVLRSVPVLSPFAGTHLGSPFIGVVDNPANTQKTGSGPYADMVPSGTNDTWTVVSYLGGNVSRPYASGFFFGEQFETSFKDVSVSKFHNGMSLVVTDDGMELRRPDGTLLRIGTGITKADLTAKNFDADSVPFDPAAGSATGAPDVILLHSSGASIRITSSGSILIGTAGGGFSLATHVHSGVTAGGANSGGPL